MRKLIIKFCWFLAISLPIALFLNKFLFQINGNLPGDWDYFAQLYEAARRSILEFHQFPWWNPWVGGGVPLYANPQFGLVSIHMPFILLFGTLAGLHISIFFYFLVGFWGMYTLLKHLGSDRVVGILLSYIWIFSSFPVWHLAGGHLTFGSYFLAPWFFYFLLKIHSDKGWLWFGLLTAFLINQSVHYITVQLFVIGGFVALYQIFVRQKGKKTDLRKLVKPYVLSVLVALPLVAHKLYYVLQYIHDYTRIPGVETGTPINVIIAALTFRGVNVIDTVHFYKGGFGWAEYASYFGIITLGLFAFLVIKDLEKPEKLKLKHALLLVAIAATLVVALGNFASYSPYNILKQLPIFDQMQVASRWLGWFVFGVILFLSRLPRNGVVTGLLSISVVEVFSSSYPVINYDFGNHTPGNAADFRQVAFYNQQQFSNPASLRFLEATESNIGDVYGYEPIIGFGGDINEGYAGLSKRCAINRDPKCDLVLSDNASISYWSPNKVVLERTGTGNIVVNINPGSYWKINGEARFVHMKVTDLKQMYVIEDPSQTITLTVSP